MMSIEDLENMVLNKQLNKFKHNKLNPSLDITPVFKKAKKFTSHAEPNVDSLLFHNNTKYDIKKTVLHRQKNIEPDVYTHNKRFSFPHDDSLDGLTSDFYGIPRDRDIVLENPTAQAMNMFGSKITEKKLTNHNWQNNLKNETLIQDMLDPVDYVEQVDLEGGLGSFMNDPRLENIINSSKKSETGIASTAPLTIPKTKLNAVVQTTPLKTKKVNIRIIPAFLPDKKDADDFSMEHIYKGENDDSQFKTPQTSHKKTPLKGTSLSEVKRANTSIAEGKKIREKISIMRLDMRLNMEEAQKARAEHKAGTNYTYKPTKKRLETDMEEEEEKKEIIEETKEVKEERTQRTNLLQLMDELDSDKKKDKYVNTDIQKQVRNILSSLGYSLPHGRIKNDKLFMMRVKDILINETPKKKKD